MTASKSAILRAVRWLEEYQEQEYARRGETPTIHEEMLDPNLLQNDFDQDTVNRYNEILRLFPGSKYDSAISRFDLCKILHHIRDKDPRPAKPSIVVGTSPSLVPNACIALRRDVSVIVHNTGFSVFFTFATAALARLIELPNPISSATLDQLSKKRSDLKQDMIGAAAPLMLKAMLIAATGSLSFADSIMGQYFKIPGEKFSISLEELAAISPILDSTNAFIISHEYAHANPGQWEFHTFGPEELQFALRLLGENATSEFDADLTGAQLALHYNAHAGRHGPEYSCLGILLFFDLMRLQRRAIDAIGGVQARNEEEADSITHPPLLNRRTRVADTIKRLHGLPAYTERGFAITETFCVAMEFIWENTRPFLEHLHKSGLAQHLAPECRVGWLTDDLKRLIDLDDNP